MPLILTDLRLASSLLGLDFPGTLHATVIAATRETRVEVHFEAPSERFPLLNPRQLIQQWQESRFLRPLALDATISLPAEPMHVFAVSMRAQLAYDAYQKAQAEGGNILAVPVLWKPSPGEEERIMAYEAKIEPLAVMSRPLLTQTLDELRLAAALLPLGFPPYRIHGSAGQHRYEIPSQGLPIHDSSGRLVQHASGLLTAFAPSGEKRLALFDSQPLHPMVIAYDATHARGELKKAIQTAKANLLLQSQEDLGKQALITLNAKGHVHRQIERHFRAAPGSLDV
jgi:hypothetical protein